MAHIETEQSREIPLTVLVRGPFILRFASYRKNEDANLNLRSEDFIVSDITTEKALFGLCDGVGSSFYGNIGSQILGEILIAWLGKVPLPNNAILSRNESLQKWIDTLAKNLLTELNSKTKLATGIINKKDLSDKDELIRIAETTQRDDFGTQSNFACGILWPRSPTLPNGLVILFWLGNARLRLFNQNTDLTRLLGWGKDPDQLREVWSSKDGVLGRIYSYVTDLSKITTVIAYSDGLENVEDQIRPNLNASELEKLIFQSQGVKDDDATFLELSASRVEVPGIKDDVVSLLRGTGAVLASPHTSETDPTDTGKLKQTLDALQKKYDVQKATARKLRRNLIVLTTLFAIGCFVGGLVTGVALRSNRLFGPTITPTSSATLLPSLTPSLIPSMTSTILPTSTATETITPTPSPTSTITATGTVTNTGTPAATGSGTP